MNLRKYWIAASVVALAACSVKSGPSETGAMSAEALALAADVTRITVQGVPTAGGAAIGETALTGTGASRVYQNVNVTPGTYDFTFRAYKQTAGSGSFSVSGNVAAGDSVTITQASTVTFTARESKQNPPSPYTLFNIGGAGAWGMATLDGVQVGDTFVIHGVVFTGIGGLPATGSQDFQVVAGDNHATAVNLANAVNGCTTVGVCDTVVHSAGITNYITATQVGAASVRFQAAPGVTGNSVAMASTVGSSHFSFEPFSSHPAVVQSNLTAGNLAAVITSHATTYGWVVTSVAANVITVAAKSTGTLTTPFVLGSSGANIAFAQWGQGGNLLVGSTTVSGVVVTGNQTVVLNVVILDTTTRSATETGPIITSFTNLPSLAFTAAPAAIARSTPYAVGDVRSTSVSGTSSVFIASVAGTTAAAGAAPTFGTGTVVDGTVTWRYVSAAPNAWTNPTPLNFSAEIANTAADSWTWNVSATCPTGGAGRLATSLTGAYTSSISGVGAGGTTLGPVSYYFVDSRLETCTIRIQVDKLRNIGPGAATAAWAATTAYTAGTFVNSGGNLYVASVGGTSGASAPTGTGRGIVDGTVTWNYAAGLPVVIGSDYKVFQITTVPISGQGGVVSNVSYVQNPLLLETIVSSKEGTCAINAAVCDPTAAYEGGEGPGECARFGAPAIGAPTGLAPWTGRCSITRSGCIYDLGVPADWATGITYAVGDQVLSGGMIYTATVAGVSAVAPSSALDPMGLGIVDGTVTWNYTSYALPAWAGNTAYAVNNRVKNNGNIYRATVAGTSALTGGPSGTGGAIVDNGVTWAYETPESGCATLTYPDNSTHAQSCEKGIEDGHCKYEYTRCETPPALWAAGTAYIVGSRVLSCDIAAPYTCRIYKAVVAGTSAGAAPGPLGLGASILDGTVRWDYSKPYGGCTDFRANYVPPSAWAAATVYTQGTYVAYAGTVFVCTQGGTSGAAAPAGFTTPVQGGGLGTSITDNTVRWAPYASLIQFNQSRGPVAQPCVADTFEDHCVAESLDCGFTDPLNPNYAMTVQSCSTGRKAGAQKVLMAYTLGSPIANVDAYLDLPTYSGSSACVYLDGTAVPGALMATTAQVSKTNSQATFNVTLPQYDAWVASTPYAVGATVVNGGNEYIVALGGAGTSAASGGPTGVGSGIVDGTVTWNYVRSASYWCNFNARVVQTVQSTPPLSGGAGTLVDEQQFQVLVTP